VIPVRLEHGEIFVTPSVVKDVQETYVTKMTAVVRANQTSMGNNVLKSVHCTVLMKNVLRRIGHVTASKDIIFGARESRATPQLITSVTSVRPLVV